MKDGNSAFDLSVVIPMDDDHGFGEACIDSWNAQSHPRERLQLVVVDPGNQPSLIRRVRPYLAEHDLLLTVTTDNEGLLYERGAGAAQAQLLVMTEGHCLAEPHAAAEILRLFKDPEVASINAFSTHVEPTIIARQQSLLEQEWIALWPIGHWRTISLRGFAIRQEIYQQLGGFRPEYRRFCANAFVVDLDRRALRLVPTRTPIIRHCNSPSIRDVAVTLRDSARGQIAWRAQFDGEEPPDTADRYLGGLDLWSRRADLAPRTARVLASALIRSIFADLPRSEGFQKAVNALPELLRLMAGVVMGARASAFGQRLTLGWAMIVCSFSRVNKRWLLNSYRRLWRQSFNSGFADFAAPHQIEPEWFAPGPEPVAVASLPDGSVAGLRARETWGAKGPFIRWSGPVFLLRLQLSPETSHQVTLNIRSVAPAGRRCLRAFLNSSRLASTATREENEQLTLKLSPELCRSDGRQDLVFTCRAMRPSDRGEPDERRLGLALFTIESN